MRRFTLPLALCTALLALPGTAAAVSSFARAYAGGQLCGAGPAPNCVTTLLYEETGGPVEVTTATIDGQFRAEQLRAFSRVDEGGYDYLQNWAVADLNHGSVHLWAGATAQPRPAGSDNSVAKPYVYGFASAWLGDTFSVMNADGSAYKGSGASTLSIGLDGVLYGTPEANLGFTASITLGRPGFLAALAAHDYGAAAALTLDSASTAWLTAYEPLPPSLSISVPATLGSFEWSVSASASYFFRQTDDGSNFAIADLSHTITVGLQTPDGTAFGSASGLFPGSVAMQPVPEPATQALWLLGMPLLARLARRRLAPAA